METTKLAANIKASVLRLAVFSQWCERTSRCSRQQKKQLYPSPASSALSDVFSIAGRHHATDLLSNRHLARCWQSCSRSFARRQLRPIHIAHAAVRWRMSCNAQIKTVPCSNAAKTRNLLKFAGLPQTRQQISADSRPKFTILW